MKTDRPQGRQRAELRWAAARSGEVRDAVARAWMSPFDHDLRPAGAST